MSFQYRKNLLSFAALAFHRQKPSRYGFVEAFFYALATGRWLFSVAFKPLLSRNKTQKRVFCARK
jgi:hypothetical protein